MNEKRKEYIESNMCNLLNVISEFAHKENINFEDLYVMMTFALEGMSIELKNNNR